MGIPNLEFPVCGLARLSQSSVSGVTDSKFQSVVHFGKRRVASSCWTNPVAEPETAPRWPAAPYSRIDPRNLPPSNQNSLPGPLCSCLRVFERTGAVELPSCEHQRVRCAVQDGTTGSSTFQDVSRLATGGSCLHSIRGEAIMKHTK